MNTKDLQIKVLKVTKDFIAVHKPTGLPTTFKNSEDNSDCVVKQIAQKYPDVMNVNGYHDWEGGLLYRLDNATNGLVLFARNNKTFDCIQKKQEENRFVKHYLAICEIDIDNDTKLDSSMQVTFPTKSKIYFQDTLEDIHQSWGFAEMSLRKNKNLYQVIDYPIGHRKGSNRGMVVCTKPYHKQRIRGKSREAETYISIVNKQDYKGHKIALIEAVIKRGMRHQIRLHLKALGMPIVGDKRYNKDSELDSEKLWLKCWKVRIE